MYVISYFTDYSLTTNLSKNSAAQEAMHFLLPYLAAYQPGSDTELPKLDAEYIRFYCCTMASKKFIQFSFLVG